jgi:pheromone a factor receptor
MALAGVELLCTIPLSVFLMVLNATAQPIEPWISWNDVHSNFSDVWLIPAADWNMNRWTVVGIQINRWSGPFCAFVFFAFFGFASEARKNYYNAISKILVSCRLKRDPSSQKIPPGSVSWVYSGPHQLIFF